MNSVLLRCYLNKEDRYKKIEMAAWVAQWDPKRKSMYVFYCKTNTQKYISIKLIHRYSIKMYVRDTLKKTIITNHLTLDMFYV